MTDVVEKTGKSVDEAVNQALEEFNCTLDDVEVEILAEPTKGLWGILGSKDAKVRVRRKAVIAEPAANVKDTENAKAKGRTEAAEDNRGRARGVSREPDSFADDFVEDDVESLPSDTDDKTARFIMEVAGLMGIEASVGRKETDETILYTLNGPRLGSAIGRRGETLDAIQYLSNIVAGKGKDLPRKRIVVDAEDYRKRREDTLVRLATRLASKAKRSGRRVVLEPMNPQERRVIHTALEKDPDVKSLSEGEEPYRRLVIYPVGSEDRNDGGRRYGRGGSGSGVSGSVGGGGGGGRYGRGGGSQRSSNERISKPQYSWGMDDDEVNDDEE
ncbi:MAG: protein jag [Peptococcaceae bacterium]|jgi:spoIIIJ-associated protein|nr:protein jag [Peptococcaceae bacterium]